VGQKDERSRYGAELLARIDAMGGAVQFRDRFREVHRKCVGLGGFAASLLFENSAEDWSLAREYGEYWVLVNPEPPVGHLILPKACRHLGQARRAIKEVYRCRETIASDKVQPLELEVLAPRIDREARLLSDGGAEAGQKGTA